VSINPFLQKDTREKIVEIEGIDRFRYQEDTEEYKKGDKVRWKIKRLDTKELERLKDNCTDIKIKKGKRTEKFDKEKFQKEYMAASVVYPELNSTELFEAFDVRSKTAVLSRLLEDSIDYSEIVLQIDRAFENNDMEEDIQEAKNL